MRQTSMVDDLPITMTSVPPECSCTWHSIGSRPWRLVATRSDCPYHGWVDRTEVDIAAVLDWLMSDWIGDPPVDLARDVERCRRPGWLPAAAFDRIAERVIEHATPCWLWPIVMRVVATARPATTAWPPPERETSPLLPYPTIPIGRVSA
jgi:hypothetical protein